MQSTESTTVSRVSRAGQATRVLTTVRKGLSTATWLCDELLGVIERGSKR